MIYNHVEKVYNKNQFYSSFKKLWVVQIPFLIINTLNKINATKKAKIISTFENIQKHLIQFLITFSLKLYLLQNN